MDELAVLEKLKDRKEFVVVEHKGKCFLRRHCGQRMEKYEGRLGGIFSPRPADIFVCLRCGYGKIVEYDYWGSGIHKSKIQLW